MGRSGAEDRESLDAVIAAHAPELLEASGVVGVGAGMFEHRPVIEVLTDADPEAVRAQIPSELGGYPLHVKRTGSIDALGANQGSS